MPAPPPIFYPANVLEGAVLSLAPDGAVIGKGADRLTDRDIGFECEDAGAAGTRIFHADRGLGASTPMVDTWLFEGRNYGGVPLTLQSSPDDTTWTTVGTVTPSGDNAQRVVLTPFACPRYVQWTATGVSLPLVFTEVWLAAGVMLAFKPDAPDLREPTVPNVVILPAVSGRSWGVKRGARRWSSLYRMAYSPAADRVTVLTMLDALDDGVQPFWLYSVSSELIWARVAGPVDFQASDKTGNRWDISVPLIEELP